MPKVFRRPNPWLLIVGLLIGLGAGPFLTRWARTGQDEAAQSAGWPNTSGAVVLSEVRREERRNQGDTGRGPSTRTIHEWAVVRYEYQVGSKTFESDRYAFGRVDEAPWARVTRYPVGQKVTVYYNELRPEQAVLIPGEAGTNRAAEAAFIAYLIGLVMVVGAFARV